MCVYVCATWFNNAKALTDPRSQATSATLPQPAIRPVDRLTCMFAQFTPPKAIKYSPCGTDAFTAGSPSSPAQQVIVVMSGAWSCVLHYMHVSRLLKYGGLRFESVQKPLALKKSPLGCTRGHSHILRSSPSAVSS